MAKYVVTRTAQPGSTANDRRAVAATATTSAPSAVSDGVSLGQSEYAHILITLTNMATCTILPWFYSSVSGAWHRSASFTTTTDDIVLLEVHGMERIALQVTTYTSSGSPNAVDIWVALVVPA